MVERRDRTLHIFNPVWISSVKHMLAVWKALEKASVRDHLTARYDLPKPYPTMANGKVPASFHSIGNLQIKGDELTFVSKVARPYDGMLKKKYQGLTMNLQFSLSHSEIERIELFSPHEEIEKLSEHYSSDWIRVYTTNEILDGDFLIAAGVTGFGVRNNSTKTQEIFELLRDFYLYA